MHSHFTNISPPSENDYIYTHINIGNIDHESNTTIDNYSHAGGIMTTAYGDSSYADGWKTTVMGSSSHAEGQKTVAIGNYSHTGGNNTIADINNMTAIGSYNKPNIVSFFSIPSKTFFI